MKSMHAFFSKTLFIIGLAITVASVSHGQQLLAANTLQNTITFSGTQDNMLVFDLRLNDLPGKGTIIRITDDKKNILFEERISTTTLYRRYKIFRDDYSILHFEIMNKRTVLKQSFGINYRIDEKWIVTRS